jgi:hypothetical protein
MAVILCTDIIGSVKKGVNRLCLHSLNTNIVVKEICIYHSIYIYIYIFTFSQSKTIRRRAITNGCVVCGRMLLSTCYVQVMFMRNGKYAGRNTFITPSNTYVRQAMNAQPASPSHLPCLDYSVYLQVSRRWYRPEWIRRHPSPVLCARVLDTS